MCSTLARRASVLALLVPLSFCKAADQPPAAAAADVPVKQVVLFSSGVGYFEHFGTISGDGSTELRFKTNQIHDVLKSLILQDLDGGKVTTITYPSQDPVEKTLRSFQVDITEEELRNAPKIEPGENWEQTTRARNREVYDYWEVRYYWIVE